MLKPQFTTKKVSGDDTYGEFIISPLPSGFGHSMGNGLRRVLLSSVEGVAITSVKINNIVHPFSTINGVKESGLDIILNLKSLIFKVQGEGPFTLNCTKKGKGVIVAEELKGSSVEVLNKDNVIAEITSSDAKLEIEIVLEKGYGFSPSEDKENSSFGVLAMDSVFSPIKKVVYRVEDERVGRKTNFDRLILKIWTNGTIGAEEALKYSAETLSHFFNHVLSENADDDRKVNSAQSSEGGQKKVDDRVYEIIIDELDLPTRVINALLREKIETVGDLVARGKEILVNLKGVGRKSISLIENELKKLGVEIKE